MSAGILGPDGRPDETMMRVMLETSISPYVFVGRDGTILWCSPTIVDMFGYEPDEVVGTNMANWLDEESLRLGLEALDDANDPARARDSLWSGAVLSLRVRSQLHGWLPCRAVIAGPPRTGLDGFVIQLSQSGPQAALTEALRGMAFGADINRVLTAVATIVEQSLGAAVVEIAHGFTAKRFKEFSSPTMYVAARAAADGESGPWIDAVERDELVLSSIEDLGPVARREAEAAGFAACVTLPAHPKEASPAAIIVWHEVADYAARRDRDRRTFEQAAGLVALALDWDAGRQALVHAADHDALTGLANRRALLQRLDRGGDGLVLYLDLDGFKVINDNHGHAAGDEVLERVAARLRNAVRPRDFVSRLGGDEFVILCPGLPPELASTVTDRVLSVFEPPFEVEAGPVEVKASIGALAVIDDLSPEEVLVRADQLLRQAKREGKQRAVVSGC